MEESYQKTLHLSTPKTGQQIIDQMKEMVGELNNKGMSISYDSQINTGNPGQTILNWISQNLTGEKGTLRVGYRSPYPYQAMVILTGERKKFTELRPEATYSEIAIGSFKWGGAVYAIGYDKEDVRKAVDKIALNLESRLNAT
jgi:hypothetical protein